LKSSTPVLLGLQKTLGIKHLVLLDMQEMMYDVLFSVLDVILLLGMPETPETHNNLRQLGYLFLQQLPKQTNKQSFNTNRKQKSLSLCCSLHTFCVI
jgi:hypothetical protein